MSRAGREREPRLSGAEAEQAAADLLRARGHLIVGRNVETVGGELDLVTMDGDTLCFVEVKARFDPRFGGAAAGGGPSQAEPPGPGGGGLPERPGTDAAAARSVPLRRRGGDLAARAGRVAVHSLSRRLHRRRHGQAKLALAARGTPAERPRSARELTVPERGPYPPRLRACRFSGGFAWARE